MALQFDGSNDFIRSAGAIALCPAATYSIEFKLKYLFATSSVSEKGYMAFGGASPTDGGVTTIFLQRNGEAHRMYFGGYTDDSANTTMVQNTWYDFYLGHDNTNNKAYFGFNGTVREVTDAQNHNTAAQVFWLGAGYAAYFNGIFDEVRVSNNIRHTANFTPSEVRYEADANTIALWHMDEGSGTLVADASASNFDLTIAGDTTAPSWVSGYAFITNQAPNTPTISSPTASQTGVSINPTVTSSAFSDDDVGDTHQASQWQVATDSGFTAVVWDSGTDTTNKTSTVVNAANGTFAGALSGETTLANSTVYYVRVRHQDDSSEWSSYSTGVSFTTAALPSGLGGKLLLLL